MGEATGKQMPGGAYSIRQYENQAKRQDNNWVIMEAEQDDQNHGYLYENSSASNESTSSSEFVDDASSTSTSSSYSNSSLRSGGSLYDLSDLISKLPKRGLSKYFDGKSQSFTSLSKVESIEDLAKKETSYQRSKAIKASKSYGGGLGFQKSYTLIPKATIFKVKKASKKF